MSGKAELAIVGKLAATKLMAQDGRLAAATLDPVALQSLSRRGLIDWSRAGDNSWMVELVLPEEPEPPLPPPARKPQTVNQKAGSGYVYLAASNNGSWKIGTTRDIERRLSQLQHQSPTLIRLETWTFSEDPRNLEKMLHEKFSAKRLYGEWFELSPEDVEEIKAMWVNQ